LSTFLDKTHFIMDLKLSEEVPLPPETSSSDPKPPTYEEATDPTFMQRVQNFAQAPIPQWPGFNQAEVSRFSRQISSQMSRNSPQPEDETPLETDTETEENEEPVKCGRVVMLLTMLVFIISLILVPITMIVLGAVYHGTCYHFPSYSMWLLVGGTTFFSGMLILTYLRTCDPENNCLICLLFLLLGFEVIWYFLGCYYVWTPWDSSSECANVYYFVYALVLAPPILVVVIVGLAIAFLGSIIFFGSAPLLID